MTSVSFLLKNRRNSKIFLKICYLCTCPDLLIGRDQASYLPIH